MNVLLRLTIVSTSPGSFLKIGLSPEPDELIAKGLDARQSASVARKTYEILSALPDLNHETAEPPMRVATWNRQDLAPVKFLVFCV